MRGYARLLSALAAVLLLVAPAAAQQPLTSNYVRMVGANFGTSPSLTAFGTDTNISIILVPKGTGSVQLGTGGTGVNLTDANGNTWITQSASATAVNSIQIGNAATGNYPLIAAVGTDANIGVVMRAKGTGALRFQSGTASGQSIHMEFRGNSTPTVGTCGTGTISTTSNDTTGDVTATGATACTVTFAMAWANTPACLINDFTTTGSGRVSAISTTAFTVAGLTSGDRFQYHCFGQF